MSELLDSLRRVQTARRVPGTWGRAPDTGGVRPRGKGAAALLATMGYGSRRRHPARLAAAVAVGFVTLGMLGAYLFALSPRAADPSRTPPKFDTDHRPVPTAGSVPQDQPPPAPAAPAPPNPPPSDDFRRALSHQRAGEFDAAIRLYESLLARGELRAQIHNNLGLIHQQRGRIDEATRHLEQAVSSDPQYARAHNNLGVLLLGQNRIVQARALFRTAADLDPRDPDAIVNLALAQKAAGSLEEAKESLLSALTLSPHSAPAHYNLAVIYDQAGEAARALEHYSAFLEYRGDDYPGRVTGVRTRIAALDKKR